MLHVIVVCFVFCDVGTHFPGTGTLVASPTESYDICPFAHCVPWRTILLDATNMTLPSSLSSIQSYFPDLTESEDVTYLNVSGGHTTPVYAVRMPSENHGRSASVRMQCNGISMLLDCCTTSNQPFDNWNSEKC